MSDSNDRKPKRDGRRNNVAPLNGQIKPKEVRNPHGRGGKPKIVELSELDQAYLEISQKIVSRDEDGPITAMLRLLTADLHAALTSGEVKAIERTLAGIRSAMDGQARANARLVEGATAYYFEMEEKFRWCKMTKAAPPDELPHPAHVALENGTVVINGPCTRESRVWWEAHKAQIKIAAAGQAMFRDIVKRRDEQMWKDWLDEITVHRRKLMRKVPKGWNCREEIYSRDSRSAEVKESLKEMKAMYDAIMEVSDEQEHPDNVEA